MGRTGRTKGPRAVRALLDLAPLADALPAPLLLADPFGHPVHPNPAFLLTFGPPPSLWTALASGPDRVAVEAAWVAAGVARGPCDVQIDVATGQALARVAPVESGRRLLGWTVALAPIPAALPLVSSPTLSPPAPPTRPSSEGPPPAQATEAADGAADDRLAVSEARRHEAEDRWAEAEARADRLADRLCALEAERPPPGRDPAPEPIDGHRSEPPAASPLEASRADASASGAVPDGQGEPEADPPAEAPLPPSALPGIGDHMEFESSSLSDDPSADTPPKISDLQPAPKRAAETELDVIAQRLSAPALRRALALWGDGAEGWLHLVDDAEVDRVAVADLRVGGELDAVRTLWATADSPLLAALPPIVADPVWARSARDARPVAQRIEVSLGRRRIGVERLLLPLRDGEARGVLLLEVAASAGPLPAVPDA